MRVDPGIVLLAALITPALAPSRAPQGAASRPGADSRPASSPAQSRPASAPAEIAAVADDESAPASKPAMSASAPASDEEGEPRRAAIDRRIRALKSLANRIEGGDELPLELLSAEVPKAQSGAGEKTRQMRDELAEREEAWALARQEREKAFETASVRIAAEERVGPPIPEGPLPHPQAIQNDFGLGVVYYRRGEYAKAAESFAKVVGAKARYFEARSLDADNQISEALDAYKRAAQQAGSDAALLASIERSRKAVEWKTKFGRPEDLSAPLRVTAHPTADLKDAASDKNKEKEQAPKAKEGAR